jgi:hypothetical protein
MPNLTPAELDLINYAALPLERRQRDAFMTAVLAALEGVPELGPGVVHRVIRATQRQFWDPPVTCIGRPGHSTGRSKLCSGPAEL